MAEYPQPDAIIFDVYETLFANSHEHWQQTFAEIVEDQALSIDGPELWSRWRECESKFREDRTNMDDPLESPPFKTYERAWADCFQRVFDDGGMDGDAAAAARKSVEAMARREPFSEIVDALLDLEGRVRLAAFSNADEDYLRPMLDTYALPFEAVASSESARVYKPHPDAFLHILQKLGLEPEEAWYVGDHPLDDIYGAHLVGLTAVWINRRGAKFEGPLDPDIVIEDLSELSALLDEAE